MSGAGRPVRFLVGLASLWVGVRVAQLWPADVALPTLVAAADATPALAAAGRVLAGRAAVPTRELAAADAPPIVAAARPRIAAAPLEQASPLAGLTPPLPAPAATHQAPAPRTSAGFTRIPPRPDALPPRLTGSGWMIVRGGRATPFAPQLGGSQAGIRLTYALDGARRLALAGRVSGALGERQREAAIGLDWRPSALPVHIVAEQRIGLSGARGGAALALIGGIAPTPIAGALRLDAYAQGGAIARRGVEGFVDGAVRVAHPVATIGAARIDLGLGAWGGAQRGAARLDAGPAASLALPVARRTMRLSLEWRQRIAGRAAPASGPAVSLGTDF